MIGKDERKESLTGTEDSKRTFDKEVKKGKKRFHS